MSKTLRAHATHKQFPKTPVWRCTARVEAKVIRRTASLEFSPVLGAVVENVLEIVELIDFKCPQRRSSSTQVVCRQICRYSGWISKRTHQRGRLIKLGGRSRDLLARGRTVRHEREDGEIALRWQCTCCTRLVDATGNQNRDASRAGSESAQSRLFCRPTVP